MARSIRTALAWALSLAFAATFAAACWSGDGAEPTPAPSASPSAAATSTVTRTPTQAPATAAATLTPAPPPATPTRLAATPTLSPAGTLIEHGPRDSGMIALTFDMGGRVEPALDIMNWLVANNVPATIFMTGAMAENPNTGAGRDVLRMIETHPGLFALGNHSYSHPDFRELTAEQIRTELSRTEAAIAKHTTVSPRPLFRPPLGAVDGTVVAGVAAAGYPRTIMWDVDTIDWRPESEGGPTAADIVARVTARAQGGSIVLMHLGGYNTFEALPGILEALRAKGLEPVTLPVLLR